MQDPKVIHTTGFGASYEPIPAPDAPQEVEKVKVTKADKKEND